MRNLLAGAVVALSLAGCAQVTEPPQPTDAELAEYIQQHQEALWFQYGALEWQRPEVQSELVSLTKYNNSDTRCAAGWQQLSVDVAGDTVVIQADTPPGSALYQCQVALIPYPAEVGYYTRAQLGFIFDYFRESLVPCLQAQGLQINYTPDRDEFTAQAGTLSWDPYTELGADLGPSRAREVRSRCPALPDAAFLQAP